MIKTNKFLENPDTLLSTILKVTGATVGVGALLDLANDEQDKEIARSQLKKAEKEEKEQIRKAQKYRKNAIFNESQINIFKGDSLGAKLFQNRSNHSNSMYRGINTGNQLLKSYPDDFQNDSIAMDQFGRTYSNDRQYVKVHKYRNQSFNSYQEDLFENEPLPIQMFQNRNNHTNSWGGIRY